MTVFEAVAVGFLVLAIICLLWMPKRKQERQSTGGVLIPLPADVNVSTLNVSTDMPANPYGCRIIGLVVHEHGKTTYVYDYSRPRE